MMSSWTNFSLIALAFILLAAAVWTDLRARKVRNQLIIVGFVASVVLILVVKGWAGLIDSGLSMMTATVAIIPLYVLRVLGGGDVKLFIVVSMLFSWEQVLIALMASFIWGSLLGVFQVILKGQTKQFAHNMMALVQRNKLSAESTHQIPYTVALVFGFATCLYWGGV